MSNELESRHYTCIMCPKGCDVKLMLEKGKVRDVEGNECERGSKYVIEEYTHPTRSISSTIRAVGFEHILVPVKTKEPILKEKIFEVMAEIHRTQVKLPIKCGDIAIENVAETGIDIVATFSMDHKRKVV